MGAPVLIGAALLAAACVPLPPLEPPEPLPPEAPVSERPENVLLHRLIELPLGLAPERAADVDAVTAVLEELAIDTTCGAGPSPGDTGEMLQTCIAGPTRIGRMGTHLRFLFFVRPGREPALLRIELHPAAPRPGEGARRGAEAWPSAMTDVLLALYGAPALRADRTARFAIWVVEERALSLVIPEVEEAVPLLVILCAEDPDLARFGVPQQ